MDNSFTFKMFGILGATSMTSIKTQQHSPAMYSKSFMCVTNGIYSSNNELKRV